MKGFRYDVNEKQIPLQRPNEEIVQLPRGKTLLDKYIKKKKTLFHKCLLKSHKIAFC